MDAVGNGWRWFRGRSRGFQIISWVVAVIVVLAIIGALGRGADTNSSSPTAPVLETGSSFSEGAVTEVPATDGDTGRMSGGEWSSVQMEMSQFGDENVQWGRLIAGKCSPLTGRDWEAAGHCIGEAYSGFEEDWNDLYQTLGGLKGDVAGDCRRLLIRARDAVYIYGFNVRRASKAGENSFFTEFYAYVKLVIENAKVLRQATTKFKAACRPA
jgi:hypothetical protein